jgi:hypothetical protein
MRYDCNGYKLQLHFAKRTRYHTSIMRNFFLVHLGTCMRKDLYTVSLNAYDGDVVENRIA